MLLNANLVEEILKILCFVPDGASLLLERRVLRSKYGKRKHAGSNPPIFEKAGEETEHAGEN